MCILTVSKVYLDTPNHKSQVSKTRQLFESQYFLVLFKTQDYILNQEKQKPTVLRLKNEFLIFFDNSKAQIQLFRYPLEAYAQAK